jgi:hypothetical protein
VPSLILDTRKVFLVMLTIPLDAVLELLSKECIYNYFCLCARIITF